MFMVLAAAVFAMWAAGFLFLWRVARCAASDDAAAPSISVIIPARDEAHNLPALLDSLREQRLAPAEVIVADDGSTDDTTAVARERGVEVLTVPDRPRGWSGKTWGCWSAARRARGELLVFVDADTRLEPAGLARIAATHRRRGGLVSIEPFHELRRPYEQLSAVFNLVRVASVGAFGLLRRGRVGGAFGPCIAIARRTYFEHQGHAHPRVKGQVLENFNMGQLLAEAGQPVSCFVGSGVIWFRMYPRGAGELVEGWAKGLASGAGGTTATLMGLVSTWVSGAMALLFALPAAAALGRPWGGVALGAAYLAYAVQLHAMLRQVGRFSWLTAALHPVAFLSFVGIYLYSVFLVSLRRKVTWRGRTVEIDPGEKER